MEPILGFYLLLLIQRLECEGTVDTKLLGCFLKVFLRYTQLHESRVGTCKVLEEPFFVLGILLDVFVKCAILNKQVVRGEASLTTSTPCPHIGKVHPIP